MSPRSDSGNLDYDVSSVKRAGVFPALTGVITYPFTFLTANLISELFYRNKAQTVAGVGFILNFFMHWPIHHFPTSVPASSTDIMKIRKTTYKLSFAKEVL